MGGREGGREGGRKGGRGEREGGRAGGREGGRDGGRLGGREGGRSYLGAIRVGIECLHELHALESGHVSPDGAAPQTHEAEVVLHY